MTPFSVKTLSERWGCSERTIRNMLKEGKLRSFVVGGTLIRISHEEVEKWETNQNLSGTEENSQSASPKTDADSAVRLARMTLPSARQGLSSSRVSYLHRSKAAP
jgi:excisionase family DNA binding protein